MALSIYAATLTGESTETVIYYGVNSYELGTYLRQFDPGDVIADIAKFRVPGTNGNLVMRNGIVGHVIHMAVRYISSSINVLESAIAENLLTMSTEAMTIEFGDKTYLGCNLIPGSVRRTSPTQSTGRGSGHVFVDLVLKFTEDRYGDT